MLLNSNSTSYFDTTKWKKKLTIPLKRHRNNVHWNGSATAKAAATEKFIRRNKQEVLSEDLTASQFANITGIKKTKRYEEEAHLSDDDADSTTTSASQPLSIWDSHFWHNDRQTETSITSSASQPCISSLTSLPLTRHKSEPGVIQKGRFKITWGMDDESAMITPEINCVEWKRKKNM
ncbi:hypothetical protein BCV72DRAFT_231714 [Rhizopus microsporus var. microsporus]|uniref:Uncharacterized protein n=2 Tax=Rhizopus microsporus TaxID=58291 RepID=A0A2G4SW90_RHIZD|nr:uncharacterized protein RHIMIDRAFT_281232 [Rhizopus microsporus ATCC 52813]ORE04346.1 hypothetical protein BCV72DRAFT_231714 [Rhizopus microsporus var. microsporus]PHZ13039.1 hypothetical protein RHIMIDRAFT_281232 [Rhizopus microsporus ATCC 52813]